MNAWVNHLLQACDSMFPTGAYAHSFGLEGLVEDGVVHDEPALREYLANGLLPALATGELPLVHAAWRAALDRNVDRLVELDDLAGALRTTRETREASRRTGCQRLQNLKELKPHDLWQSFTDAGGAGHAVVVFGMECALWEVPARAALAACAYQALAGQVAAAFKLISIGQSAAQRLLNDLMVEVEARVDAAMEVPPEQAGGFTPLVDIASARHERAYSRLFIS